MLETLLLSSTNLCSNEHVHVYCILHMNSNNSCILYNLVNIIILGNYKALFYHLLIITACCGSNNPFDLRPQYYLSDYHSRLSKTNPMSVTFSADRRLCVLHSFPHLYDYIFAIVNR